MAKRMVPDQNTNAFLQAKAARRAAKATVTPTPEDVAPLKQEEEPMAKLASQRHAAPKKKAAPKKSASKKK